jgi:thiosulfate/3-mercaptopyruvate sulfurtransferase
MKLSKIMTKLIVVLLVTSAIGCIRPSSPPTDGSQTDYPNSALLVKGNWLNDHIDDSNLIIIDTRASDDYGVGHVKNAINLPPSTFDGPSSSVPTDMTNLINIEDLANILGQKGVSNNAKIIIYGESIDPSAGRVFWVLEYLGATDVHMLDGGYDKWKKDGYATVIDKTVKDATTFAASVGSPMLATKSYVLANYNNSGFSLVDGRNHLDYKVKRIPNAVNLLVGDYLNSDNTVKSYSQLRELFDSKGITSWTEWNADSSLPTEP